MLIKGEKKKARSKKRRTRIETLEIDLSLKNLCCEELDFEIGEEGLAIGGEDRGGDFPSSVGLLKLNEPLIRCYAVA